MNPALLPFGWLLSTAGCGIESRSIEGLEWVKYPGKEIPADRTVDVSRETFSQTVKDWQTSVLDGLAFADSYRIFTRTPVAIIGECCAL